MDTKLAHQIRFLSNYIQILKQISRKSRDEYLLDYILSGAAERYLQLAIETCINIGNRIISLEQFEKQLSLPETYADVFETLEEIGIIDSRFGNNLKDMARFRNRLVHVYWEIDDEVIYNIIQNNISDLEDFLKIASEYELHRKD